MGDLLSSEEIQSIQGWLEKFQGPAKICFECDGRMDGNCPSESIEYGQVFLMTIRDLKLFQWVFPLCGWCTEELLSSGEAGVPNIMDELNN